jgi:hypothetical protein
MAMSERGDSGAPAEKPVLLEAVNLTLQTIERRARVYRNLVVGFSLTALGLAVAAVVLRRWVLLAGLVALPLLVAGFLFLDGRIVRGWRERVFLMRDQRGLKVAQLGETLTAFRYLPAGTLCSMLAMLISEKRNTQAACNLLIFHQRTSLRSVAASGPRG